DFPILSLEYQELITEIILQVRLDDLDTLFDYIRRHVLPNLPPEYQEKFIIMIILKSTHDKLDAILNFVERFVLPHLLLGVSPEQQETVIVELMDILLPRILKNPNVCMHLIVYNVQFLSQVQQESYAERIFSIVLAERPCNADILFSFAKSSIFDLLTAEHKEIFAIQMAEEIKLDDLNECARLVIDSPIFKFSSYEKKVQILIRILNHHNSSFFDFSSISFLCSSQAPITDLPILKTIKICDVVRELISNPSPDIPETRILSQTLLDSFRSALKSYNQILVQFQRVREERSVHGLPPMFLTKYSEIFVLSGRIKDYEQKKRESRDKSKTSELI
ncbi:MAG: hypothetical protein LBJ93_00315, partial [Clostridiales bacterium]|nr:hypothetical protein [Clostridiales bacterium]